MTRLCRYALASREISAPRQVTLPPRLNLPNGRGFFRLMPTVMNRSGIMGFKAFHGSVQDGVRYLIAHFDTLDCWRALPERTVLLVRTACNRALRGRKRADVTRADGPSTKPPNGGGKKAGWAQVTASPPLTSNAGCGSSSKQGRRS